MDSIKYAAYLKDKIKPKSIGDRISRCHAVERALDVDLDIEFEKDHGCSVINALKYKRTDQKAGKPFPSEFVFKPDVDVIQRITDLRSAVKKYFAYKNESN